MPAPRLLLPLIAAQFFLAAPVYAQDRTAAVAPIRVYAPGEISPDRYRVLERLWVDSWRSAFRVPSYDDPAAAFQALVDAANQVGADGLVNVQCLSGGMLLDGAAHFCYGNAIRLLQR